MKLYPDQILEYEKRHNPIWPGLEDILKTHGVSNYSIFFDESTNILFGYAEIDSEEKWNAIAATEVCQKWWEYMSKIMHSNPDNSPKSTQLKEVFYLQ